MPMIIYIKFPVYLNSYFYRMQNVLHRRLPPLYRCLPLRYHCLRGCVFLKLYFLSEEELGRIKDGTISFCQSFTRSFCKAISSVYFIVQRNCIECCTFLSIDSKYCQYCILFLILSYCSINFLIINMNIIYYLLSVFMSLSSRS